MPIAFFSVYGTSHSHWVTVYCLSLASFPESSKVFLIIVPVCVTEGGRESCMGTNYEWIAWWSVCTGYIYLVWLLFYRQSQRRHQHLGTGKTAMHVLLNVESAILIADSPIMELLVLCSLQVGTNDLLKWWQATSYSLLQGWDYQWTWAASPQCKCWHTGRHCTPQQHGCEYHWVGVLVNQSRSQPCAAAVSLSVWIRELALVVCHYTTFWCFSQFGEEVLKGRCVAFHTVPKVKLTMHKTELVLPWSLQ